MYSSRVSAYLGHILANVMHLNLFGTFGGFAYGVYDRPIFSIPCFHGCILCYTSGTIIEKEGVVKVYYTYTHLSIALSISERWLVIQVAFKALQRRNSGLGLTTVVVLIYLMQYLFS
jgi:hypothetical protein